MTRVQIMSFVRRGDGTFVEIAGAADHAGECEYLPGAVSFRVDGTELFGLELWDDVNWLWPLMVQVFADCRRSGSGKRWFPDQPISMTAERVSPEHVLVRVTNGSAINRSAVAPADELFQALAVAGLHFFGELHRLCPDSVVDQQEREVLASWLGHDA
ncbi:MAG: hypothetical protein HGA44_03135 [Cellulomonadaceae bacterium]|nr:hypothetical protein [Cellulomonadaceae bacterium]